MKSLLFFLPLCILPAVADAQATRTWVSATGDDVNPCSRTSPCKTFAGAFKVTARGGEISVLDPGGYGFITITRSVTIDGTGVLASSLAAGAVGITINLTDPSDTAKTVRIRGLAINGASSGQQGIKIMAANRVSIEESVIDGFLGEAIAVASPGGTSVLLRASTLRNNGTGVSVAGSGNQVALSEVAVIFNGVGATLSGGGSILSFKNNVFFGNGKDGAPLSPLPFR